MPSLSTAIPLALLAVLLYAALCAVSPFGPCRKCHGFGFKVKQNRRGRITRGRNCRRCKGYGMRLRAGRHVYNAVTRLHREGTH